MADVFQSVKELPARNYVRLLRQRVSDLSERLEPAYYDQYPGRRTSRVYAPRYGPIPLTTARRDGATGFEANAALASRSAFLTPVDSNIKTGRTGKFRMEAVNAFAFLSWTYQSNPGFTSPIDVTAAADLFDPAIEQNGGASALLNYSPFAFTQLQPSIAFELELYDVKRGASLTDGPLPIEAFAGTTFGPKELDDPVDFPVDSEIEPRIYISEFRMGTVLDADVPFNAASVVGWISLVFEGADTSEDHLVEDLLMFSPRRS